MFGIHGINENNANNAYLIEIDEEFKFIISNKKSDIIKDLHDLIYKDYNILWSINDISQYTKQFIESNIQNEENNGFYQNLEDLDKLKQILNNLNSSLSSFQSYFKIDITNKDKDKDKDKDKGFADISNKTNISTRLGDPLSKNMEFRKLPSIWNANSFLEGKIQIKEDNNLIDLDSGSYNKELLSYNDISLGNLYSIVKEKNSCFIYYNKHYNNVITLDKNIDLDIFPELKYINTIDGAKDDIENLKEALEHNFFFNIEQLEVFVKYYNVKDKKMTQQKLKKFIKKNYNLNDKLQDKIKFTILFNQIIEVMLLKEDKIQEKKEIKQLLPIVLKSLKLSKKRYKDGNYWYGIELKKKKENITDVNKLFEKIMKERNDEAELRISEKLSV